MRKLARRVGVTAPALYRHFESREDVLLAVVSEAYKSLSQYLYPALGGGEPMQRFALAAEAYLDFALENPRLYEMIYASLELMGFNERPPEIEAQSCAVGQFFHDRVRECMDAGYLVAGDTEQVSMMLWAHSHGLISIYLKGLLTSVADDGAFRELYANSSRAVILGIGTDRLRAEMKECSSLAMEV